MNKFKLLAYAIENETPISQVIQVATYDFLEKSKVTQSELQSDIAKSINSRIEMKKNFKIALSIFLAIILIITTAYFTTGLSRNYMFLRYVGLVMWYFVLKAFVSFTNYIYLNHYKYRNL